MPAPKFVMPPTWGQLSRDQKEAMRELFGAVTEEFAQKCYEEQLLKIQEHNDALEKAWADPTFPHTPTTEEQS